jgi:hypothetical protein
MIDCRNCGVPLHGRFCHACGQKTVASRVRVHDLLHEGVHEFLHLDGKIFQTLRLLITRPGALTLELLAGRRARYISPVRLYLTCSLLFFAVSAVAPASLATVGIKDTDVSSPAERQQAERAMEAIRELQERIRHNAPRSMFVLMPVFGLLTWALYRRAEPYYVPHLYYSIHFHSFVFLMMAVAELCSFGGRIGRGVGGLFPLTILPYHYLALRRVFGGSRLQVAWKGTAIAGLYLATIAAILIALLAVTIKRVVVP